MHVDVVVRGTHSTVYLTRNTPTILYVLEVAYDHLIRPSSTLKGQPRSMTAGYSSRSEVKR